MLLNNVGLLNKPGKYSIRIAGDKIISVEKNVTASNGTFQLDLNNGLAVPGLINSHDHLDFNLFPMLGTKHYSNYTHGGNSIHKDYKTEIDEVLKIPGPLRVKWGIYKNLLCGVTTVVNHGKYLKIEQPLINVIQPQQNLHSVGFQKWWKIKLNDPFKTKVPCVIHLGEGTDDFSKKEIDKFIKWNLLKRKTISIHGVAMNEQQANNFMALTWCPASNYFLFGKTAAIERLKTHVAICFGTDSTLTSHWNIWQHVRMARESNQVDDKELFEMLTIIPAALWGTGTGYIEEENKADIIIVKTKENSLGSLYEANPDKILLIIHDGQIRLFDEEIRDQVLKNGLQIKNYSRVIVHQKIKYVAGDLPELMDKIHKYNPNIKFPVAV